MDEQIYKEQIDFLDNPVYAKEVAEQDPFASIYSAYNLGSRPQDYADNEFAVNQLALLNDPAYYKENVAFQDPFANPNSAYDLGNRVVNPLGHQIANSIFTMGGLLGNGTPAPPPTSDGNDRAQQNIMALQNQFDTQDLINSGVISRGSSQAADEFFNTVGDLTTTQAAEAATISQVALPSDGKAIRTALENAKADGTLGKYADSFASKSSTLMGTRYQEKTGISPGLLADMQKIVKAKGAA